MRRGRQPSNGASSYRSTRGGAERKIKGREQVGVRQQPKGDCGRAEEDTGTLQPDKQKGEPIRLYVQ